MCKIFVALNFRGPDHPRNYFNGLPVPCVKNGYRKEISLLFIFVVKKISCVKFSWFGATTKKLLTTKISRSTVYVILVLNMYVVIIILSIILV